MAGAPLSTVQEVRSSVYMWLNLCPFRGFGERMFIRTDGRVRLTSAFFNSDSGVHGEWWMDQQGNAIINVHYMGNGTGSRRTHTMTPILIEGRPTVPQVWVNVNGEHSTTMIHLNDAPAEMLPPQTMMPLRIGIVDPHTH